MNWLAHLHLSGNSPTTRIGNLLPDILPISILRDIDGRFSEGVRLHRAIDSFTDQHEIFRETRALVVGDLRRYSPIFIDMFYDHFLARDWSSYCRQSLAGFVKEFHDSIEVQGEFLPELALTRLREIRDGGLLLSYRETAGIELALQRIGKRTRRQAELAKGIDSLLSNYAAMADHFHQFYPQLEEHVAKVQDSKRKISAGE